MTVVRSGPAARSAGALWTAMTALSATDACTQRDSAREASLPSLPGSAPIAVADAAFDERNEERHAMVERQLRARDVKDERVLAAMRRVPRHRFVRAADQERAYGD